MFSFLHLEPLPPVLSASYRAAKHFLSTVASTCKEKALACLAVIILPSTPTTQPSSITSQMYSQRSRTISNSSVTQSVASLPFPPLPTSSRPVRHAQPNVMLTLTFMAVSIVLISNQFTIWHQRSQIKTLETRNSILETELKTAYTSPQGVPSHDRDSRPDRPDSDPRQAP